MRDYGSVSPQFWIGQTGKALRGNMPAQILALYLMTSPHANMIGVFYCPIDYMAKETGMTLEGASEALQSLVDADFCRFDHASEEVFVVRMAAFQVGDQLDPKDNRCKGVAKELEKVTSSQLRQGFRANYAVPFNLPLPGPQTPQNDSPSEAPSDPLRSQKQNQEQKQDQEIDIAAKAAQPADKLPSCPHVTLINLFGQHLPTMPQPKPELWSGKNAEAMKTRWRWVLTAKKKNGERYATSEAEALDWFGRFFGHVATSDFLSGRSGKWTACDLGWLMKAENFAKVVQGNYDNKGTA